jgi:peptidylprolyl isomerase
MIVYMKFLSVISIRRAGWVALVLAALLLSACGGSGTTPAADTVSARFPSAKTFPVQLPSGPPPNGLVIKDLTKGKGAAVPPIANTAQVKITALYTAVDYKTGELYEEREDPHDPYVVEFDSRLDDAWEQGLPGMKAGGRRELIVPANMSFHDLPLVYVIRLLRVERVEPARKAGRQRLSTAMSKREIANLPKLTIAPEPGPAPRHVEIIDLRKGTGATVKKHDTVNTRFVLIPYPETRSPKIRAADVPSTQSFELDHTVKGWQVGLPGMKVGGRRKLILPPKLVYPRWKPSWGYAHYVSIYIVDLLGIERSG